MTPDPRLGQEPPQDERRRRIRRNTILLVLVAVGIYVAFIVSSIVSSGS